MYVVYTLIVACCVQVGPQVLVLGEEAQKHGLATSLLQRMHQHYIDNAQSAQLLTC